MAVRIIPPKLVEDTISLQELIFLQQQAEKRLVEITSDADKLYQRSVVLLSLSITLLVGIVGYLVSHLIINTITLLLISVGAILWVAVWILKPNIKPDDYWGNGTEPVAYLMKEAYFTDLENDKSPHWYILYAEVISYQERIDDNKIKRDKRADRISEAVKWLYWIPPISLLIVILSTLFGIN